MAERQIKPAVAIVEDDEAVLDSLKSLLMRRGFRAVGMTSAASLLASIDAGDIWECIVSDVRMPVMSGTALHEQLKARGSLTPMILITGHGDVDLAVAAMKAGVDDFIEKPIDSSRLVASINDAIDRAQKVRHRHAAQASMRSRFEALSDRQREVMLLAAKGHSNKEMAQMLKLSSRTVEHYREWVMEKMQAKNFADLVQMAMHLGLLK